MPEPIRVVHFADIHVGMENYGSIDPVAGISSRVMDFLDRMDDIIDFTRQSDADLVIFAGDAFKSRSPNPTYLREFAKRIHALADLCPVVMVVGNHDMPAMRRKATTLSIFQALAVDNVIIGSKPDIHLIETKRGPVQVATVPYPMRQRMLGQIEELRGESLNKVNAELRDLVSEVIDDLANNINPDIPSVLTGHFTVQGSKLGSEQGIMLGQDVAVMLGQIADPIWDYVALGHIHAHQNLNKGQHPAVVYSGSLERIDFGERRDEKGFCYIELDGEDTRWEFIPVPARPFVLVKVDVREYEDPMPVIEKAIGKVDVRDSITRVVIEAMPEQNPYINDRAIEDLLTEASHIDSIQHHLEHRTRRRLGTRNPEEMTEVELLRAYFEYKEMDPERIEELIQFAYDKVFSRED